MNILGKAAGWFRKSHKVNGLTAIATLEEFTNILKLTDDYGKLAQEGYIENCIVNTCIRRTAEAMNSIPCHFMLDGEKVDKKTSDRLIKSIINSFQDPSADYNKKFFIESIQSQIYIKGEAYVYLPEDLAGGVAGLEFLRPDRVNKVKSEDFRVHRYEYNRGSRNIVFTREKTVDNGKVIENPPSLDGRFNMVIFKTYHPKSDMDGLSRISSCALSVDGHNNAMKHNNSVMKNAGKVSGILTFGGNDGAGSLKSEQIKSLYDKITERTTGSNKGSILIANNEAKFEKFSLTPQEMDFLNGLIQRAIDICNALDYPPYLLGFTGATFSNQDAAKLSLYENSAIPKIENIYNGLTTFLNRKYDINLDIKLDLAKVPAMAPRFKEMNDNIIQQYEKNIINHNEVREKLDYEPVNDGTGELYFSDFSRNSPQPETQA